MTKKIFLEPDQSAKDIFDSIQKLIPTDKRKTNIANKSKTPKVKLKT